MEGDSSNAKTDNIPCDFLVSAFKRIFSEPYSVISGSFVYWAPLRLCPPRFLLQVGFPTPSRLSRRSVGRDLDPSTFVKKLAGHMRRGYL